MLFYVQLQQMDGKWNDKWAIMVRKWIKYMSISDEKNRQFQGPAKLLSKPLKQRKPDQNPIMTPLSTLAREIKHLALKDLKSYLILEG